MLYNFLLNNIILPAGDTLLGTSYIRNLRQWRKLQHASADELRKLQRNNLEKLLSHAVANVPYYRGLGVEKKADPYKWLSGFPILYKNTIKANMDSIVLGDKDKLVKESSSGSSGIQGTIYLTRQEASISQAIQTLWWEWAGYRFGHSILQTGITPNRRIVKRIKDILLRTDYVVAFGISEAEILNRLRQIQKKPRKHMGGYASSLYLFAKVARENNIRNIRFDSVISWGDKLFPHYRALIESQFGTRIFDTYGCTEGIMIGAQKDRTDYYVMSPHVHVELLDDEGREVRPGQLGKVVVTRLDAFAMPLIRYYLGDLAEKPALEATAEPGELHFPRISRIIGRDTDIVKTASGKFMVVHSFTGIFEHIPEIKQFRVIQRDLSGIEIEYIPDSGFAAPVLDQVQAKINGYLHEDFPVSFREVEHIPATPSGKPQIIQSFLKQ